MQDVVIIGSGPAGLSAALYMLRGGFSTTVIGKDNGALEKAEKIENYFGLERPLSGHELIENGRTQVQRLGGTLLQDEVVGISWNGNYLISTASTQIEARAIILTTGTSRKTMKIKNLAQLEGRGVSYCAVCDAFLYRGESVAVLGNNGLEPSVDFPPEVTIIQTPVLELVGTDTLEAVCLEDGTQIHPACLFMALGTAKGSDLARKLGIRLEDERIIVNEQMDTGLPGVFAAGDCIGGILQVSVAVGEGAKAALSCIKYLRS